MRSQGQSSFSQFLGVALIAVTVLPETRGKQLAVYD